MTKEERELRVQANKLKQEARDLVAKNEMEKAKAKVAEAKDLIEKADLMAELDTDPPPADPPKGEVKDKEEAKADYRRAFFSALRRRDMCVAWLRPNERSAYDAALDVYAAEGLHETPDENGGLLLPQDIQTKINEYKRTLDRLESLVDVIATNMKSGSRVYETLAELTPFENLTSDDMDLPEMIPPKFEAIKYDIKDYGGWTPIPNDLLEDTDQNIIAFLVNWIGKKSVVTRNQLICAKLNALDATPFADYKAIKKAINVTLDPIFAASSIILTNQDGYQYLDTLEDKNGRPLMQVDITNPSGKVFAGKSVRVVSNSTLPTETSGTGDAQKQLAPIFIGNIPEYIKMFERKGHQIASTNIGGTAFRKNRTEMRVIEREDVVTVDAAAVVRGAMDVTGKI
ncbi:phage major capsid protein [Anaeromassilibacillus senegalensis]|uniref:phage major capsid protein n=1 Tax=Anaeromassilibacillus senegalensis TaxID=1673717 RepID=UPI0006802443|nr:phage major capsid protein [Anaeromassilibacillus senegalensis]